MSANLASLQQTEQTILAAVRAAREIADGIGGAAFQTEVAACGESFALASQRLEHARTMLASALGFAYSAAATTCNDFVDMLAPSTLAPQTVQNVPSAPQTAQPVQTSTAPLETAPVAAQDQQTASKPTRKTRSRKPAPPADRHGSAVQFPCSVCGGEMGFDAPSGVCSTSCLERAQGFAHSTNGQS